MIRRHPWISFHMGRARMLRARALAAADPVEALKAARRAIAYNRARVRIALRGLRARRRRAAVAGGAA